MSGYKRVNFYELCRLCATNQQKEKTHIFQEEGRKIQLQSKIQSCLSLKVCENDFLPKVVCSQCLRTLEECYTFRNECVTSESMLSSYFNNFRYTEDFKKSGKVYIKDTGTAKIQQKQMQHFEFIAVPNPNNISNNGEENGESVYVPTQNDSKNVKNDGSKPLAYNLSTINFAALKGIVQNMPKSDQQINNIAVSSASGEIINITPLIDLESILVQNQLHQKAAVIKPAPCKTNKKIKTEKNDVESDLKRQISDKLPHIKSTPPSKFAYAIKIEESLKNGGGSAVVVNQIPNVNTPINHSSQNNFNTSYNSVQNVNVTSNTSVSQTNWNFTAPANTNGINLMNNNFATNNQTMFNQTSNWNLITTTAANVTTNNLTPSSTINSVVTSNIAEHNEKLIQGIQDLPQDNKQNILNGNRNNGDNIPTTVDISSIKSEPLKLFNCELCTKVFKRREHLYQHVKLHTGFRPFGCENCKKSFMRKEHLMRHLTSHTGQKNFTCNICEKSFSRNDNLLKHKKTHEKQSSYTCEICQKQFVMKHYYLAHKMGHESSEKCQFWNILKT